MPAEYSRSTEVIDDRPLSARRLAAIWAELPERERFPFILALDERLCDAVIELTSKPAADRSGH